MPDFSGKDAMSEIKTKPAAPAALDVGPQVPSRGPLVVVPPQRGRTGRGRRLKILLALLLIGGGGLAIGWSWWQSRQGLLPVGIASGNGRLEADQIDIDTKFAGRIAKLLVDEGDMVRAGQVVAVMDTGDLAALLKKAEAVVGQAQHTLDEAKANLAQQQTQLVLAQREFDRTAALVPRGHAPAELLDQRRQLRDAANAAQDAAVARVGEAAHALEAATHDVGRYEVDIADNTLVAPRQGRIEYRVANVGEVLPAGGKVFTMLDTGYVYLDAYLPTKSAGRVELGSEARIVLDAYPGHAIPARVVFIASQAQFTPKTVETADEREALMFRVRVRIDPGRLAGRAERVGSGLPGVAYLRTERAAPWPPQLQASPAP